MARADTQVNPMATFHTYGHRVNSRGNFASMAIAESDYRISINLAANLFRNHRLQMFAEIEALCLTMQETVFHRRD